MTHTNGQNTATKEELHPLKQLRRICGISSATLSEITGIPANTIRAAEISRRKGGELSENQLNQIVLSIGALWAPEAREWLFIFTNDALRTHEGVPYRKEHFESFRAELKAEAHERAGATGYLLLRLMALLESAPDKEFNGLFWRTKNLLDEWGAKKLAMSLSPNWSEEEMRALGYRKEFYWLNEDRGNEGGARKFAELVEAYRAEREREKKRDAEASEEGEKPAPRRGKRTRS
jgi:hypothetical protein